MSKTRKKAGYYAPLPVGHGLMILEEEDKTHRIPADSVIHLQSSGDPETMLLYYGKGDYYDYHRFQDIPVPVIEDMYFRALRGEIARSAEYHENGARLDGTPLLINHDYQAKLMLMQQRQNGFKSTVKIDGTKEEKTPDHEITKIQPEVPLMPKRQVSAQDLALAAPEAALIATSAITSPFHAALPPSKSSKMKDEIEVYEIGELVPDKGVFIGEFTTTFNKSAGMFTSKKITRTFNVFTTPEDIKNEDGSQLTGSFNDVLAAVARIENICGHSGTRIERNTPFRELLEAEEGYKTLENWFIPPHEILRDHIHHNRAKGVLSGTFNVTEGNKLTNEYPSSYAALEYQEAVLDFYSGESTRAPYSRKRSVRPVRLELKS
jgi:hypothetical protein